MKQDFLEKETELNNVTLNDQPILYLSTPDDTVHQPKCTNDNSLILPLQTDLTLQPSEIALVDLAIQIILPKGYLSTAQSASATPLVKLYHHTGVTPEDTCSTLKNCSTKHN